MKKILLAIFLLIGIVGFSQKSGKYTVKDLSINSEYSDFGPAFYKNKQIIFSSPKKKTLWSTIVKDQWKPNGQRFLDLYSTDIDVDGQLINKTQINDEVNSKYHEANVAFTNDYKTVFFTRNNYFESKVEKDSSGMSNLALYKATIDENGNWIDVVALPFNSKDYSVGHPALSNDNKKLYFVSDMPGGKGGSDIYITDIMGDNSYGKPTNISQINTSKQEMFPYISKNNILYYSTDGDKGLGGLDIFAYNFESNPIHLESPLNSPSDDFSFIIDSDKKTGYFSSNRTGGKGDDDIYLFTEDVPLEFDCKQYIVANVIDSETKKPISGAKLFVFHNDKLETEKVLDASGTFKIDTKCKEEFAFKASMDNYEGAENTLKTSERNEFTNKVDISLNPIKKAIVEIPRIFLGPVRFDFDKSTIRKSIDADVELDRIIAILNQYPEMIVSIESFTDARGENKYNQKLSQKRAEMTKEYLVKKGIAANRITGVKGRGEELPINQCINDVKCTEEEHQANRRTEFVIVNPESYQKQ